MVDLPSSTRLVAARVTLSKVLSSKGGLDMHAYTCSRGICFPAIPLVATAKGHVTTSRLSGSADALRRLT